MAYSYVFITGATGFIAKRIIADLLNTGVSVRGSLRNMERADEVRDAVRPALDDPSTLDRLDFVSLDLGSDAGWDDAMIGCDALLHTASPFPLATPKDENDLIKPAVDGTLRALRSALAAGISRVVLTSSVVAVAYNGEDDVTFGEDAWSDPDHPRCNAYPKSKTLAEKAAWDFAKANPQIELSTVNPGLVAGRPMDKHFGASLSLFERILAAKDPAQPVVFMPIVDVEDVSTAHIKSLQEPAAIGRRIIASDDVISLTDVAGFIATTYPDRKISRRVAPYWLLWILGRFDNEVRSILPLVGRRFSLDTSVAQDILGMKFVPAKDAIRRSTDFLTETSR